MLKKILMKIQDMLGWLLGDGFPPTGFLLQAVVLLILFQYYAFDWYVDRYLNRCVDGQYKGYEVLKRSGIVLGGWFVSILVMAFLYNILEVIINKLEEKDQTN